LRYDAGDVTALLSDFVRGRDALFLLCFFAGRDEDEAAGDALLVGIGEAMDDRGLKKKHPMTTVAATPRTASGIAVANDKQNGRERRATAKRRVTRRDVRYRKRGNRSSIVCRSVSRYSLVPVPGLRQPA
jgi:hypothetical protein